MRFGLQIPNFTVGDTPGALFEGVVAKAAAAEETGFDYFVFNLPTGTPETVRQVGELLVGCFAD